jgi:hypothetical protein
VTADRFHLSKLDEGANKTMRKHKLRNRMVATAIAGTAALAAAGSIGVGVADAAPADPAQGAPNFFVTRASEPIRGSGSDTTFFMMQKIGDVYTAAGLYGCTLVSAAGQTTYPSPPGAASVAADVNGKCQAGANVSTTDTVDNWNRVEVSQGVNLVGSGAGQNQLCGVALTPQTNPVNFARSSKPSAGIAGCNELELGYAKDGVPVVDFPSINPSTLGTSTFSAAQVAGTAFPNTPYNTINGGVVGPVAAGWLPGDNPSGAANNGTKLTNISNVGAAATSVAYRLWCVRGGNQIADWGGLTNLGPNLEVNVVTTAGQPTITVDASSGGGNFPATIANTNAVTDSFSSPAGTPFVGGTTVSSGSGTATLTLTNPATTSGTFTLIFATGAAKLAVGSGVPIGIPVRILGVNTASGTEYTFSQFANGQTPSTGCNSNMNVNAANDLSAATAPVSNSAHLALENNAHQLELFSQGDFGLADTVDQGIAEATTLYFMSNGVYNTNPYVSETNIGATNYAANKLAENGSFSTSVSNLNNSYPTARTLSNIVNSGTVSSGTAGFMNWMCDANTNFTKGTDLSNGLNYDTELSNVISTVFGFARLTDTTAPVALNPPADNVTAPNDDCVAQIPVTANGTNTLTYAGPNPPNFPSSVLAGAAFTVMGPAGAAIPAGTTVTSPGAGSSTITVSNNVAAGNWTLEFFGVPAVTQP